MMTPGHLWLLLSAVAGISHALICTYDSIFDNHTNSNISCPSDNYCSSTVLEFFSVVESDYYYLTERTCVQRDWCHFDGSFTAERQKARIAISCCDTNYCTPTMPSASKISPPPLNGATCPTCHDFNKTTCDKGDFMFCRGNETRCSTEITNNTAVYTRRGCATDSFCNFSTNIYFNSFIFNATSYMCDPVKNRSPPLHNDFTIVFTLAIVHILFHVFWV
ncbi:uncharacterized protein LOC120916331 [Rana temporaria]|uniref:uncharacterized protein LOC120916331 n=1 Tax=Rana temporaria TaxID=8407 RepID=UPI001AAE0753|nr:uncharacterized protein LOC120916331 [Rana temporaria]